MTARVCQELLQDEHIRHARVIACYDAFDGELDLRELYEALRARPQAPTLVFPVHQRGRPLRFFEPTSWRQQGSSYRRPVGPERSVQAIDLALIPGVAFSEAGLRLGFGGGVYDRTFPERSVARRAAIQVGLDEGTVSARETSGVICFGVAFSLQLTSTLPCDPWDLQVDAVVTERGCRASHHVSRDLNET